MASSYPGGLDAFSTTHADNVDEIIHASTINDNSDAINKIEAELGTDPKGSAADVKTRIANTETVANAAIPKSTVTTKGDLMVASGSAAVSRLGVGTDGQVLTLDSAQTLGVKWANVVPTRQIFTASGTYTLPSGCKAILVECIGGGGAGGGTPATSGTGSGQAAAGGGGGGGSYAASLIASPSSTYAVTIGAGGTCSAGAGGTAGGNTSFGTAVIAEGGQGAPVALKDIGTFPDSSGAPARGGLASNNTGDLKIDGSNGKGGWMGSITFVYSGGGGGAARGGGSRDGSASPTVPGNPGRQYGGGGCGASATTSATAQAGGAGAAGAIIVTEYY